MTGEDFEHRLRKIEDWCLAHDEKCKGRDEKLVASIEAVKNSLEKEVAVGRITDGRVDALRDEIIGLKVKLAFIAGVSAAGGSMAGPYLFKVFGG